MIATRGSLYLKIKLITYFQWTINEEEPQVDDIVSALWLSNGQYYDAKVLQKGGKRRFSLFLKIKIFFDKFIKAIDPGKGGILLH